MQGAAEQAEINSKAIAAAGEAEAKTLVESASKARSICVRRCKAV